MHLVVSVVLLLTVAVSVAAQDRASAKGLHAPGPWPDRVVLTWRKDPARTQSVTWRTDTSVATAVAECQDASAGADGTKRQMAATAPFKSDLNEAHFHSAHFDELTPDTRYAYRVGDGVHWSEWRHFRTASARPDKFTFLYFGDAQTELKNRWAPLVRKAFNTAADARFSIHAGDLVDTGDSDAQWGDWFQAALPINRTMPVIPTPGNHEYMNGQGNQLPGHWNKQFSLPDNGPPGLGGVFHLDFQGVRIISLNTNEKLAAQVEWLRDVLKNNPNRWTIVAFHHPLYSATAGRDDPELRKTLQPAFDLYGVDLVLQGHDHCYGRSELLSAADGRGGAVYVVSVSGPRFYPLGTEKWMARWGENLQLFQVITIDGDSLHFQARTGVGDLYDSFTLHKQAKGRNVLTNGPHDPRSVEPRKARPGQGVDEEASPWVPLTILFLLSGFLLASRLARRARSGPNSK